jgi:hypothetical protein
MEARVNPKKLKCPHGCSGSFVSIVYLQAPGHLRSGTKNVDRMLRGAAESQGLSDISTSPSAPGGNVMDRIRKKQKFSPLQQAGWGQLPNYGMTPGAQGDVNARLAALTGGVSNPVAELTGIGKTYDPSEWTKTDDGKVVHSGAKQKMQGFRPAAEVLRSRDPP